MPYRLDVDLADGFIALRWKWEAPPGRRQSEERRERTPAALVDGELVGRGDGGQSWRSLLEMKKCAVSLPWWMAGDRLVYMVLTYPPGDWEPGWEWCADGRVLQGHLDAFVERWRRKFGSQPLGMWGKEFQDRGAPHLNLVVGLPPEVAQEDYLGLRKRTLLRMRMQRRLGVAQGRRQMGAIGGQYGGEFARWLLAAWAGVVGTAGTGVAHERRGVDVTTPRWADDVEASGSQVALYMAGDLAKRSQKLPPKGFTGMGNWYGVLGRKQGFKPYVETHEDVEQLAGLHLERLLKRYVRLRVRANAKKHGLTPKPCGLVVHEYEHKGVTALMADAYDKFPRLWKWSQQSAQRTLERKRLRPVREPRRWAEWDEAEGQWYVVSEDEWCA